METRLTTQVDEAGAPVRCQLVVIEGAELNIAEDHDFGATLVNAGDINGDGYADVLVGAPNAPQAATFEFVQAFWGNALGRLQNTNGASQVLRGNVRNKQFGYRDGGCDGGASSRRAAAGRWARRLRGSW